MADIGKRIKARREELGLTQEELAKKLGYKSKTTITKIENGTNDIVQSKVKEFSIALDTTVAYLMGWEEEPETKPETNIVLDSEALELLEELKTRPEMRTLFSVSRKATKEDILKAVKIIEALKGDD